MRVRMCSCQICLCAHLEEAELFLSTPAFHWRHTITTVTNTTAVSRGDTHLTPLPTCPTVPTPQVKVCWMLNPSKIFQEFIKDETLMHRLFCLNTFIDNGFVSFVFPQFVCRTVFKWSQMGGVAPPLDLSPLSPYPPPPPSLWPPTLTAPGEMPLKVEYNSKDPADILFVFSQYPSLWPVGASEQSPAHSPCPAHPGPLSNEIFMQPPNSSRVDGAGWPPGSTHSF